MSESGERRIALAAVAGAHGVRGEVRLKLFSEKAENLAGHRNLIVGGAARRLLSIREGSKTAVARFDGISDRAAAEAIRGALVEVERSDLPPLEEGEYYHADLVGVAAVDQSGNAIGTILGVDNYGAGDLLEIELEDGRRSLIPFSKGIADLADGKVVVDPEFLA